jgi:CIC family chloride channel protein
VRISLKRQPEAGSAAARRWCDVTATDYVPALLDRARERAEAERLAFAFLRSAHDVGWLRDLTVGKLMRRNLRTVRADTNLSVFRRQFPLGSANRVVAVWENDRYAGLVPVPEAHLDHPGAERVADLLQSTDQALLPAMNAKEAMAVFDVTEADALVVVDAPETRRVLGLLSEAHLLRRYGEEVDKRRREEIGLL